MFEDLDVTDIEYFTRRDLNLYKLAKKSCCIDCFEHLLEMVDYLTFDPTDALRRQFVYTQNG